LPSAGRAFASRTASRPSHPASHVRDDREASLLWKQDGPTIRLIRISEKAKYFSITRLTRIRGISPVGQITLPSPSSMAMIEAMIEAMPEPMTARDKSRSPAGSSELAPALRA